MRIIPKQLHLIGILNVHETSPESLLPKARAALDAGLPALMLRIKNEATPETIRSLTKICEHAERNDAKIILNGAYELSQILPIDILHFGARSVGVFQSPRYIGKMKGFSAHSFEEAVFAARATYDYITLSPIFTTVCKPDAIELGIEILRRVCAITPVPVIALGGINAQNATQVFAARAFGIAAIHSVFGMPETTPDIVRLNVRALVAALLSAPTCR